MNLLEMDKKVLALIEELNPDSDYLTDDPDIAAKKYEVMNQVMFELARIKKIPKYVEIPVSVGDTITFEDIESESGYEVYQLGTVDGVTSIAPSTTLTTDAEGALIECEYNKDANKVVKSLEERIAALEAAIISQ
jgi:hypothetical protein